MVSADGSGYDRLPSQDIYANKGAIFDLMSVMAQTEGVTGLGAEAILLDMKHGTSADHEGWKSLDWKRRKNADAWLEENAKRQISGKGSTLPPMLNKDASQEVAQVFNKFFVGQPLPANFNIGYGGRTHEGTGSIVTFREEASSRKGVGAKYEKESRNSWKTGDIEVTQVLFNTSPGPDGGGITLRVTNDMGDTEDIFVSKKNFENTELSYVFQSPIWRTAEAKNRAKNKGLDDFTFTLGNGTKLEFDFTKAGGDRATFFVPTINSSGQTVMKEINYNTASNEPNPETELTFAEELQHLDEKGWLPF